MERSRERRMHEVVASRRFQESAGKKRTIIARLGKPRWRAAGEWSCAFHISGAGLMIADRVYGVDALQALLLAAEAVRIHLEQSGITFSWCGGEPGDTGIPRFVPIGFGSEFSRLMDRVVDREIAKFVRSATKARKRPISRKNAS